MTYKDITGRVNGRLTALEYVGTSNGYALWRCRCECGGEKIAQGRLLNGAYGVRSCGCLLADSNKKPRLYPPAKNRTHGDSGDKTVARASEYTIWASMQQRCKNPNHRSYANYGGRGIKIDPRWDDYQEFLKDMGRRPSAKHSIDRVDANGNYTYDNCRWATAVVQAGNRRNSRHVIINGSRLTPAEASVATGIPERTIHNWISTVAPSEDISTFVEKRQRGHA